jgi:hypothetical protein
MSAAPQVTTLWVMGGFPDPEKMLGAARRLREMGYTDLDAYTPYPLHDADDALKVPRSKVPLLVAAGGFTGAVSGYLLQWFANVKDFPINVGGRPIHAWPLNIPITFELGVLLAALSAFIGVFALSGLPRPHHPVFEVEGFRRASVDRFWVSVALHGGPGLSREEDHRLVRACLQSFEAEEVAVVEELA